MGHGTAEKFIQPITVECIRKIIGEFFFYLLSIRHSFLMYLGMIAAWLYREGKHVDGRQKPFVQSVNS